MRENKTKLVAMDIGISETDRKKLSKACRPF